MRTTLICLTICLGGCGKTDPVSAGGRPVAEWVAALTSPDAKIRKTAALKLGNVGPADPTVLPALIAALEDRDPKVRSEVVLALVKFGPDAREAAARLEEMRRKDPNAKVRDYAGKLLDKLAALE